MGRKLQQEPVEEDAPPVLEPRNPSKSLRSKAAHLVSDLTTVLLNPISDKPSHTHTKPSSSQHNELDDSKNGQSDSEEGSGDSIEGPDTSSFSAFLYSLLASSEPQSNSKVDSHEDELKPSSEPSTRESAKRKSLFSRGKQSLGKAFSQAAKLGGFRNQSLKSSSGVVISSENNTKASGDGGIPMITLKEEPPVENLPETSESSLLLSEKTRSVLYTALPVVVKGLKWVLLYSTGRHGISLSTLYRRSMLCPGLSLLVVGDRNGAIFGGLVEAPLKATSSRRYQGTNDSFLFTNVSGHPLIYRPTGMNRYFTLCCPEYLALGGGSHFALYLDEDLLSGSSSSSETYGNPCLARSQDFQVKEIELWGFVYASKYEELIASLQTEAPGICHWV